MSLVCLQRHPAVAYLCLVRPMRRAWIRGVVSFVCGFILVGALYRTQSELSLRASSRFMISISDILWTLLDWPPSKFFSWVPHERGYGPGMAVIVGPIITNIVAATIIFYIAFTLRARHKARSNPQA